jgi:hypothetical protein
MIKDQNHDEEKGKTLAEEHVEKLVKKKTSSKVKETQKMSCVVD